MQTQFALDLCTARKKAGLTQGDIAHLLAIDQSTVSKLEHGSIRPTLPQIIRLSLIYQRSFESLFTEVIYDARIDLTSRLSSLPPPVRPLAGTYNRNSTLTRLERRLAAELKQTEDGGA